jgi:hypothetical protein
MSGQNRPFKYGPMDRREFIVNNGELSIATQNDANGNPIYIGKAKVGTLTSESKWQISKQTYDASQSLTRKEWPQNDGKASSEYEFVWDDRLTFTYS